MDIGSIGSRAVALPQAAQVQESEAAELAPDKEAAKTARANATAQVGGAQAPLPSYAGTVIDTQA